MQIIIYILTEIRTISTYSTWFNIKIITRIKTNQKINIFKVETIIPKTMMIKTTDNYANK